MVVHPIKWDKVKLMVNHGSFKLLSQNIGFYVYYNLGTSI